MKKILVILAAIALLFGSALGTQAETRTLTFEDLEVGTLLMPMPTGIPGNPAPPNDIYSPDVLFPDQPLNSDTDPANDVLPDGYIYDDGSGNQYIHVWKEPLGSSGGGIIIEFGEPQTSVSFDLREFEDDPVYGIWWGIDNSTEFVMSFFDAIDPIAESVEQAPNEWTSFTVTSVEPFTFLAFASNNNPFGIDNLTFEGYEATTNPGSVKWSFQTGGDINSCPAIALDGTIYFGSEDSYVYAINPDGSQKWAFSTGGSVGSNPAIGSDGTIYIPSDDHNLYALDPEGNQKWAYNIGSFTASGPAIAPDGTIYVGSYNGNLYAINPSGSAKWVFSTGHYVGSSPAIGTDGTIYVGSYDNNVYAINPEGTEKWRFQTGHDIPSSPAIGCDGTIFVGSRDNNFYAINPDGTQKWVFSTNGMIYSSPAVGADGTIYVGSRDYNLYAINPDGTQKWVFPTGADIEHSSPAIGADGTIYVGSDDRNLYAVNSDGTQKWKVETGDWILGKPTIADDGTVYVGSNDNKLYAVYGNSGGLADTPWPKFHKDLGNRGFSEGLVPCEGDDGPIAYYPFNGNANDESGNGFDGTVTGATLIEDRFCNPDSAYRFDGVDDFIETTYGLNGEWHFHDTWTVSYWINDDFVGDPPEVVENYENHWSVFGTNGAYDHSRIHSFKAVEPATYGWFCGYTKTSNGHQTSAEVTQSFYDTHIESQGWQHVVITSTGGAAPRYQLFIDGVEYTSDLSYVGTTDTVENMVTDDYFTIGAQGAHGLHNYLFKGALDDFRIYKRVLSATEVQELFAEEQGSVPAGYITNLGDYTVSVIDTKNNQVIDTIPVAHKPYGVAVNSAGTRAYVAAGDAYNVNGFVEVIDTSTGAVVDSIQIGNCPYGIDVHPSGSKVYVANHWSYNVSVIDTATNSVTASISAGTKPFGVAMHPDGDYVYITVPNENNGGNDQLLVIDTQTDTVHQSITVGDKPLGVAVHPDGTSVYVANNWSNSLSVIDTAVNTVSATISVPSPTSRSVTCVAVHPSGNHVYVVNHPDDTVTVIDTATNSVIKTIPVGDHPYGIDVHPDGSVLYVANEYSDSVSVIDVATYTVIGEIPVGSMPIAFGKFIGAIPYAANDSDGDGTPDCTDGCPDDPNKIEEGDCGCGFADTDTDGDGIPDCNDLCPDDPAKVAPGGCGCGTPDTDTDGDGTPDCIDSCPTDPGKVAEGTCGCGTPDTDSDGDGTPDCIDGCPSDPAKVDPGTCGCGTPDTDTDGDGTPDCIDSCPTDPNKVAEGTCGCGVPETDTDGDGTPDCIDACPEDPNKIEPGGCGCGVADLDEDADGVLDCEDNCLGVANIDQADLDGDGIGDLCDTDADGDGYIAVSAGGDDCDDYDPAINPGTAKETTTLFTGEYVFMVDDYAPEIPTADVNLSAEIGSDLLPVGWDVSFEIVDQDDNVVQTLTSTVSGEGLAEVAVEDLSVGVYTVTINFVADGCYYLDSQDMVMISICDPEGGFITGGGWYTVVDESTGKSEKAHFGFNAKYKKDESKGNIEFKSQFEDIDFKSTSVDWLVIYPASGWFAGQGTYNGADGYYFRVVAKDFGEPGNNDEFDIKIWDGDPYAPGTTLVYSSVGVLGGGNIKVHQK